MSCVLCVTKLLAKRELSPPSLSVLYLPCAQLKLQEYGHTDINLLPNFLQHRVDRTLIMAPAPRVMMGLRGGGGLTVCLKNLNALSLPEAEARRA